MPSRLRFVLSQLGPKPGARQSLARLVDAAALPAGVWSKLDQRTWRTGRQQPAGGWARRAAEAGSVTAWRSFRADGRGLWAQLVPLASSADAELALESVWEHQLRNLGATVTLVSQSEVEVAIDGADRVRAIEQQTRGPEGNGVVLMLAWTVGEHLMVLAGSGEPSWSWDALAGVAAAQTKQLTT